MSCLCSEVFACDHTENNEVDVLPNISQVREEYIELQKFVFNIFRRGPARNSVQPTPSVVTTLGNSLFSCLDFYTLETRLK